MDRLLLIETSGRVGHVGLADGSTLLAERTLDENRRHARDLAPAVADLLRQFDWRPRDLAAVLVSLGPGSYTGLRVGIMSAKALAYATGCAVVGVPTFQVIATQTPVSESELEVIADAQQEKLYLQAHRRIAATQPFVSAGDLRVVPGREWATARRPNVAVTGPGLVKALPWLPKETVTAPPETWQPTIGGLLNVGWELFRRGIRSDPLRLEPLYLRPSSAEEQWDRRPQT
jgi:tRNA threonylcarbamoyladenosine biosynthesis protein TsaB